MRKKAGFTLIELIIFTVVIGIIVPSIVGVLHIVLKKTNAINRKSNRNKRHRIEHIKIRSNLLEPCLTCSTTIKQIISLVKLFLMKIGKERNVS